MPEVLRGAVLEDEFAPLCPSNHWGSDKAGDFQAPDRRQTSSLMKGAQVIGVNESDLGKDLWDLDRSRGFVFLCR